MVVLRVRPRDGGSEVGVAKFLDHFWPAKSVGLCLLETCAH